MSCFVGVPQGREVKPEQAKGTGAAGEMWRMLKTAGRRRRSCAGPGGLAELRGRSHTTVFA